MMPTWTDVFLWETAQYTTDVTQENEIKHQNISGFHPLQSWYMHACIQTRLHVLVHFGT